MKDSKPNVTYMASVLRETGFFILNKNGLLHLILGREVAENDIAFSYLAGVDPRTAEVDACGWNNAISDEAYKRLKKKAKQQ